VTSPAFVIRYKILQLDFPFISSWEKDIITQRNARLKIPLTFKAENPNPVYLQTTGIDQETISLQINVNRSNGMKIERVEGDMPNGFQNDG
jgi:hypothetical protein